MSVTIHLDSLTFGYAKAPNLFERVTTSVIPTSPTPGHGFVTVLMGESGCGKTTLLRLLLGDVTPNRGAVCLEPRDTRMSYLSQDPVFFDHLSVRENARYFLHLRSTRLQFDQAVFERASRELGLSELLARSSSVSQLSGGERQRIALLRALSIRPSLLLLDEPCRGLDARVRQEFIVYLRQLADEFGLGVVYVTHQQGETRLLADRILFLVRPSTATAAKIVEGTLREVVAVPRHEVIAMTFSDEPVNRVSVELRQGHVTAFGKVFALANSGSIDAGRTFRGSMVFRASQIRWNADHGVPCRRVRRAGQFVFATAPDSSDLSVPIIGPHLDGDLNCFDIQGEVFIFGDEGDLLTYGRLCGQKVGASG